MTPGLPFGPHPCNPFCLGHEPKTRVATNMLEVLKMTSPQERQMREQRQKIKREYDTRFLEGGEHMHFDGDIHED